jgi:3-oxoacyl-[acyl-carrier-protein] synthase II
MAAGIDAVEDSKILESQIDHNRIGVSIGSGIGGLRNIESTRDTFQKKWFEKNIPIFCSCNYHQYDFR